MIRGIAAVALLVAGLAFAQTRAAALGPYPSLGACQVFPQSASSLSPRVPSLPTEAAWNQDISHAPLARDSAATIAYIDAHGDDFLHPDFGSPRAYGFPYAVVGAHQRRLPVHYTAPDEPGEDRQAGGVRRGPRVGAAGGRAQVPGGARVGVPVWARPPRRYDEVAAGHVDHAIRVTFDSTRNAWVHPASHCAGDTNDPRAPTMGTRLRLRPGYGLGRFHGAARTIAIALKRYGLIVADNGSNWFFGGTSDRRWDDASLGQLKRIPGSAFQVVRSRAHAHAC